ncbi:uncharacterized protein PGTG_00196 [Puccinia graminis f. sp. tritici CRL 75-36-700-3]|uniref:Uncharacterized protein n=1 Tax=Puccinia graminis f. sp. tritici (strain CRL 75-36-700-3 / race SCCL) TaxID=418459 RepID=E3JR87_PUCGT|nr:uncharacterized protein PGTG_00196 [Puccinia graminis f. sp. tritici CRL 75-36-700-3]EFP74240.2 hypothetical protein PGTG_00196 [Puccinia graminis f. sp. tritici CRL 75-36-700-3]
MPTVSKILCPETQMDEEQALIDRPPCQASIHIDYLLYINSTHKSLFPSAKVVDASNGWSIVTPARELAAMLVDLQSMTWNHFQGKVIEHLGLGQYQSGLLDLLTSARHLGSLHWHAWISGNVKFSKSKNTEITGQLAFLGFATCAYDNYPNKVVFKIVMREPPAMGLMANDAGNNPANQGGREDGLVRPKSRVRPTKKKALPLAASHGGLKDGIPAESERKESLNTIAANQSTSGASTTTVIGPSPETQGPNPKKRPIEEPDEIEVIHGPNLARLVHAHTYRAPLGPESAAMEAVDMETYLRVSHIEDADQATRRRLRANGITHWTFFRRSSEAELVNLGFPLGITRLLCEGVPRLTRYVEDRSLPL